MSGGKGESSKCPQCGAALGPNDRFCMQCGLPREEAAEDVQESVVAEAEGGSSEEVLFSEPPAETKRGEDRIDFREVLNYPFSQGEWVFFKAAIPFSLMVTLGVILCAMSNEERMWPYYLAIIPFSIAGGYAMTTLQRNIRDSISSLFGVRGSSLRQNIFVVSIPVTVGIFFFLVVQKASFMAGRIGGNFLGLLVMVVMIAFFIYVTLVVLAHYAAEGVGLTGIDYSMVKEITKSNWFGFLAVLVFWITGFMLLLPLHFVFMVLGIYCLFRYRYKPRKQEGLSFIVDLERRLVLAVYDRVVGRGFKSKGPKPRFWRSLFGILVVCLAVFLLTWIASLYWLTTVSARLLAHVYRGEKIEFRRLEI